jgi:transglutaminase-like putative cysteine protease
VVATAIFSTSSLAAVVPESGLVSWRNASGFSGLFGGFSINLFTSMQQDLVGNDATVAFVAKVSEPAPPNGDLYWKLITLDAYDGEFWLPGDLRLSRPLGEIGWEADEFNFRGTTIRVNQNVEIYALRQNFLPLLYSPVGLSTDDLILADSYRARADGSINFDTRTSQNLSYSISSRVPVPDLASLATVNGQLSPIFGQAVQEGVIQLAPAAGASPAVPARLLERYTDLPDNLGTEIAVLAAAQTQRGSTPFEKVLLLESFFRSTNFVYDPTASSGHSSLDLTEWLTDPESRNFRRGYCEQFATAMAVMARTLDIPSRVVLGFAPGEIQPQPDGSDLIVVRALHGHAWVEVFLPSQGWVRFDPTPRGDEINTSFVEGVGFEPSEYLPAPGNTVPGQSAQPTPPVLPPGFEDPGVDPGLGLPGGGLAGIPLTVWLTSLILVTVLVATIPTLKALRRRRRLARLKNGDIGAAWAEITDRLADLGFQLDPSRTPRETAISIDRALLPLAFRLSADVYGERIAADREAVFHDAEARIKRDLSRWQWWWASVQPRSLIRSTTRQPISDRLPAVPR